MSVAIILVAAGRGRRFGGDIPKQYVPIAGKTSFTRCLERFLAQPGALWVQPVIHPDDTALCEKSCAGISDARLLPAVSGGETRAASVIAGLDAVAEHSPHDVLIHDAARPFVSDRLIAEIRATLESHDAAFAALPVVDALWACAEGATTHPVPREGLWRAQTPQGFRYETLRRAHAAFKGEASDDVEVVHQMGIRAQTVLGDPENFKVTNAEDLHRAELFAQEISSGA